jgi:two-component system sensor histidine kinase CiaH
LFRKLKIQLITINLVLLSLLLAVIFSMVYASMKQGMERQSEGMMRSVIEREHSPRRQGPQEPPVPQPPVPQPPEQRTAPNFFSLKVDAAGQILESSSFMPISTSDAEGLLEKTFAETDARGTISYDGVNYRYLKETRDYGSFLVFDDKTLDEQVLRRLVLISLVIGGLSLIMVFFISLFLANRALVPIAQAWDKQKAFVADASHELRTPLAVISTNLELVMGNADETVGSQAKWIGNIQSEIQRMSRLVSDLLFLARADAGEAIPMSVFNISYALNQAVVPLVPFAASRGLELASKIEPDVFMRGNEGRLKQLVAILIDNAIKHTAAGGRVELKLRKGAGMIEITVSDTGEGIPGEHQGRIFERFYRIDRSRSREHGAAGLGLSIADCIVKEHGGTIGVSSAVGKGTAFSITLPRSKTSGKFKT